MLRQIQLNTDETGAKLVQIWISKLGQIDNALSSGDMKLVGEKFGDCIPIVKQLIPHIENDEIQELLTERTRVIEGIVQRFDSGKGSIDDINSFLIETYNPLQNIFNNLLQIVINLIRSLFSYLLKL